MMSTSRSDPQKPWLSVVTPRFPFPLNKGDRLRIHHQLAILKDHYRIDLHCLTFRRISAEDRQQLDDRCDRLTLYPLHPIKAALRMVWGILSRRPFQVLLFTERRHVQAMRKALRAHPPDILLAQMVRTAEYVKDFDDVPHILDIMDTLHAGAEREAKQAPWWKRGLLLEESRRLHRYEHRMPNYFDACTIISEQDRQLLPHPDRSQVFVVPNGVDTDFFDPNAAIPPLASDADPVDVAFCGNLGYAPNVVAARFIVREVAPAYESLFGSPLKVAVCGAQPAASVMALSGPHVTIHADVPDIRSAYMAAPIFLAPMLVNTGLQNKLLEALALERVCITTPLALSALDARALDTVLTASTAEEFARLIRAQQDEIQSNPDRAHRGRQFAVEEYGWARATAPLLDLLQHQLHKPVPPTRTP